MSDNRKVIVALDKQTSESALALASTLDPDYCRVKVGKELFTHAGPGVVEALHKKKLRGFFGFEIP